MSASDFLGGVDQDTFIATQGAATTTQYSPPVLIVRPSVPISTCTAENPGPGSPSNVPVVARTGATSDTGLRRSNKSIKHSCSVPQGVARAVYMAGAMGGQIVQAIRNAIKAALAALGISPSGSAFSSYLKKITRYVKDITKFINDVNNFLAGMILYVNAIKQFIEFLLTLPAAILAYFAGCLKELYAQLKAGYMDAIGSATGADGSDASDSVVSNVKDLINSTGDLVKSASNTVSATNALQTSVNSTVTAAQTTASVYAGFGKQTFAKA